MFNTLFAADNLAYFDTIAWAVVFVFLIVVEMQSAALTSIWFMPGALAAIILSLFDIPAWIEFVVFFVLGTVLLVLTKTVFKKFFKKKGKTALTNTDLLIGETAIVTEDIENLRETGAVKIHGQIWTARMTDDSEVTRSGEFVRIDSIQGCKLYCTRRK